MKWLVTCLFLAAFAGAAPAQETRIAAVVNDDIVTIGDLNSRISLVEVSSNIPDTPDNRQRLSAQVLRTLIDEKLEMQDAKRLNITVSQDEINQSITDIENRNNMPKGGLDKFLDQHGIPHGTLVDQITASLAFGKIVRGRISPDVSVSDDEVTEAMKRLQADIGQPQSRVAEIFLAIDNPSQEAEVRQLADRLIDQIRGGANFSAVAQQFSQSPSAAVGGDIGWVAPSELSPELAKAIQRMNPGQMSYPVRTPAGFYILYVVDRRTLGSADPSQITLSLDEVVFQLAPDASPEERQRVTAQAQQVANEAKSCGEMSKIGKDRAPQLSRQIPELRASDLSPDARQLILGLKVAEASKPIALDGGIGVVMVCQRQDPAALPSRDDLLESLARERLDALARRYMSDLRRSAYIDIRG